jgi:poly-gamma-glutamate synthesis protein (capsule biosynthesis protein)
MLRSDLRSTAPTAIPAIAGLLKGDVVFTNLEAAVALPGQSASEGRGFLTPPETLDALKSLGFNLLSLSNNHAFDLGATGIQNTIREAERRQIVHAGVGNTIDEAAAPAYLRTPKRHHCAGVERLRSHRPRRHGGEGQAGRQPTAGPGRRQGQRREERSPCGAGQHAAPGGRRTHPAEHPPGPGAGRSGDRLPAQSRVRQRSFATIFTEGMAERLSPNEWLKRWVRAEVDAGADIVVMHGAPLLHGVEFYRGRPIFYDLGNFIYNVPPALTYIHEPINFESAVAHLEYQGRTLRSISIRPIVLNVLGEGQPDVGERAANQFLFTRGCRLRPPGRGRAIFSSVWRRCPLPSGRRSTSTETWPESS